MIYEILYQLNWKRFQQLCIINLYIIKIIDNLQKMLKNSQMGKKQPHLEMTADLQQFSQERMYDKYLKSMSFQNIENEGIKNSQIQHLNVSGIKYPYKNKIIKIRIQFSDNYPIYPPKMYVQSSNNIPFLHANVYHDNGQICHELLQQKKQRRQCVKLIVLLKKINELIYNPNFLNPANNFLKEIRQQNPQKYKKMIEENANTLQDEQKSESQQSEDSV